MITARTRILSTLSLLFDHHTFHHQLDGDAIWCLSVAPVHFCVLCVWIPSGTLWSVNKRSKSFAWENFERRMSRHHKPDFIGKNLMNPAESLTFRALVVFFPVTQSATTHPNLRENTDSNLWTMEHHILLSCSFICHLNVDGVKKTPLLVTLLAIWNQLTFLQRPSAEKEVWCISMFHSWSTGKNKCPVFSSQLSVQLLVLEAGVGQGLQKKISVWNKMFVSEHREVQNFSPSGIHWRHRQMYSLPVK